MIARGSLWLPLGILMLLAALSFWVERSVQGTAQDSPAVETDPEGIMENFEALRTDPAGRPRYRLSAKKLRHYSGSRLTELESPHFVQLDAVSGDVSAAARQATISASGDEVDLRGNVVVERAARPDQPAMTLRTAQLLVFPDLDLLRAPGAVAIQDGSQTLHAGAMEYDSQRRVIKLSGRVQARYIPGKG
ncbi:MAG: LPS export ABC transporter periplasmic protein LptC [Thiobacillus sp.]|jgi:lipopolysaccharide export system protein LptC|uniref:LPS export ABC transporter periplasmic protein LptC n=1 Tax=Thiobacillus sp. TaxID=924 RepID=UPI00289465DA|nr:LPS export ABC transporter periplasmic protein LptC [Thiobacillus sp.]MDT3708049.1 LPS export ABC transporter periplasmic protein LptC [Thiobacillus sp.]